MAPVIRDKLTCRLCFASLVATLAALTRTCCLLQGTPGDGLDEIQQKNDLYTPLRMKRDIARGREKRQLDNHALNKTVQDEHKYYTSQFYPDGRHLWTDLRSKAGSVLDEHLSSSRLHVKDFKLSFEFPYYGHLVTNATLTTGGFILMGTSKSRVANVQFIAPLMAYFNPSLNDTSTVHHFSDENEFIVQWSSVLLHDTPRAGSFTFQCMLNRTGEIVFSYHKIPIPVSNISNATHAVNVGISDAFYVDKLTHYFGIWKILRIFYAYDAVHINQSWVADDTAVVLRPKPSCITARTCEDCIERRKSTEFYCTWCNNLKRCSDGFDRHRTEWLASGCNTSGILQVEKCVIQERQVTSKETSGLAPWIISVICICAVVLFGSVAWLIYAFTHPNSTSGLWLIKHSPGNCRRKTKERNLDSGPTNSSVFNKVLT